MINKDKLKECFEYLDTTKTDDTSLLIDWLMSRFKFTPEQADFCLKEWVCKQRLDLEADYQIRLKELRETYEQRLLELASKYPPRPFPSRTDSR